MSKLVCTKCGKEAENGIYCPSCGGKLMYVLDEEEEETTKKSKSKKEEKKEIVEEVEEEQVEEEVIEEEQVEGPEPVTEPENVEEEVIVEESTEPIKEEKKTTKKENKIVAVTADGREVTDYVSYKPKKKKGGIIAAIIIILILLAVIGVLIYFILNKDTESDKEKDKPIEEKEKEKDKDKEQGKNAKYVKVYHNAPDDNYNTDGTHKYDTYITDILVENIDDYEVLAGTYFYSKPSYDIDGGIILYRDGKELKLHNSDTKTDKILKLSPNYEKYRLVCEEETRKLYGIEIQDGIKTKKDEWDNDYVYSITKTAFYNTDTQKELYDYMGYHNYEVLSNDKITAIQGFENDDIVYYYVLDRNKEKTLLKQESDNYIFFDFNEYDNFLAGGTGSVFDGNLDDATIYVFYNGEYKVLETKTNTSKMSQYNKELYFIKGNKIIKYDKTGTITFEKEYESVLDVIRNYFLIVENNKLVIKDENDLNIELGEWKDTYYYHEMISGYYDADQLDNEQEKDAGIYLIIETDEKGESSGVEYKFDVNTKNVTKYDLPEIGGYAKPVLYLYPEEETNVTVTFENKNNITVSYPKFKNSWEVVAKPNGDLYDKDGKFYYGLYWEEELNHKVDFSEGFYVEKEDAIEFLEEKLESIGLNDKERNEFIMYWLPILEKNEKNLVYFELTEERNNFSKLIINPVPDSILRLAIHVKKVNEKVNIKEEVLPTFERVGFTAVEWGGVLYK